MKVRLPQGMGGGAGNMQAMLKKMQEDMVATQEELEAREYETTSGGGMVYVKANGKKELEELGRGSPSLKPEALTEPNLVPGAHVRP